MGRSASRRNCVRTASQPGIGRIKRLRKKLGLRCIQVCRFTITTDSAHQLPVADNLLAQTFTATRPNETWVTDITYVSTGEGWLYVAGVKDLYTCEAVGHAMEGRMTTDLVSQALVMAVGARRLRPGTHPPLRSRLAVLIAGVLRGPVQ